MIRVFLSAIGILILVVPITAQPSTEHEPPPTTSTDLLLNTTTTNRESFLRADLIIGAPFGLRVQHRLGQSRFWAEIGGGIYLISPNVYIGLRTEGRFVEFGRHSLLARPGLVTAYNFGYDVESKNNRRWNLFDFERVASYGYTAVDCDFTWRCRWADQLHGELGLKLGLGIAYSFEHVKSSNSHLGLGSVIPVPMLGVTCGLNY